MTSSNTDRVRQLSDWLSGTDIARLELRGPGESICLQREGGRIVVTQDEPAPEHADAPSVAATAASVGVFLHRHPLHATAIAEPGTTVRCGQVVGLLQIGALLLPVASPCDGVVAAMLLEHGTTAGYGERLVELHPLAGAT
jgi:acetyl-CoA carboxylase biotin carboxyl carrier protein